MTAIGRFSTVECIFNDVHVAHARPHTGTCVCSQVMRIIDNVRPDRQTVMFSATFPRTMERLARKILQQPVEVQVGGRSVVCLDVEQNVVSALRRQCHRVLF